MVGDVFRPTCWALVASSVVEQRRCNRERALLRGRLFREPLFRIIQVDADGIERASNLIILQIEIAEIEPRFFRPERETDYGRFLVADVLAHRLDLEQLDMIPIGHSDGSAVCARIHVSVDLLPHRHVRDFDLELFGNVWKTREARLLATHDSSPGCHQLSYPVNEPIRGALLLFLLNVNVRCRNTVRVCVAIASPVGDAIKFGGDILNVFERLVRFRVVITFVLNYYDEAFVVAPVF